MFNGGIVSGPGAGPGTKTDPEPDPNIKESDRQILDVVGSNFSTMLLQNSSKPKNQPAPIWKPINVSQEFEEPKPYTSYVWTPDRLLAFGFRSPIGNFPNFFQNPFKKFSERFQVTDEEGEVFRSAFDMIGHDSRFGFESVINRLENNISGIFGLGDRLRQAVKELVDRTDDIRTWTSNIMKELEGVRVIAGSGTPIETVRAEARAIAESISAKIADNQLGKLFSGNLLLNESRQWLSKSLADLGVATLSNIPKPAGWTEIFSVFSGSPFIDGTKIQRAKDLIASAPGLLSLGNRSGPLSNLVTTKFTFNGTPYTGVLSVIQNLSTIIATSTSGGTIAPGIIRDAVSNFMTTWVPSNSVVSTLWTKFKELEPLKALSAFFRDVRQRIRGIGDGILDSFNFLDRIGSTFKFMADTMFNKEYEFPTDVYDASAAQKLKEAQPGLKYWVGGKHTGLLLAGSSIAKQLSESDDKLSRLAKVELWKNFTTWITEQWGQFVKDLTSEIIGKSVVFQTFKNFWLNNTFITDAKKIVPDFDPVLKRGLGLLTKDYPKLSMVHTPTGWE